MDEVCFLIKVGKKENIESLQKNGILYMKSIKEFMKEDELDIRNDIHEGIEKLDQVTWIKLSIGGKEIEMSRDSKEVRLKSAQLRIKNNDLNGNIFSMIAISTELIKKTNKLDERLKLFGDSFLIIYNPVEFIRRIREAHNKLNLEFCFDLVRYYDELSHDGELSVFHKRKKYEHENEFRIFTQGENGTVLFLNVGTLEDISKVYSIDKLPLITFEKCL